ncbi:MAG: WD40 repeat domain-containing protein [Planctomycetes bacterium]|nr:WD40 repeat domain-containing protein [Planctomycetota bacterium]
MTRFFARIRFRFTLGTLLAAVLLAASAAALVWNWAPWQFVLSIPSPSLSAVEDTVMMIRWPSQVSEDGRLAVVFHDGQSATVWDMETGKVQAELAGPVYNNPPWTEISPGGRWLASLDVWSGTIDLWDLRTGKIASTLQAGTERGDMSALSFSPDGTRLATRFGANGVRVWKVEDGSEVCTFKEHADEPYGVSWSLDGRWMVSVDRNEVAFVWSAATAETERVLCIPEGIRAANFLRKSPGLITSSVKDSRTILINVWKDDADEVDRTIAGNGDHYALSPDETRVATFGADNYGYLWDLSTGKLLLRLNGNESWTDDVTFSPDGMRAVTGGGNNPLRLWDLEIGAELCAWGLYQPATFLSNGDLITQGESVQRWHRRRPEPWWGIAWLPEFWLTVVLSVVFVRSLFRGNVDKKPAETAGPVAMH